MKRSVLVSVIALLGVFCLGLGGACNVVLDDFTSGDWATKHIWTTSSDNPLANANWIIEPWNGSNQLTVCPSWAGDNPRILLSFSEVPTNGIVNISFDLCQIYFTAGNQFYIELRQGSSVKHVINLNSNAGAYGWGPVSGFLLDGWMVGANGAALNVSNDVQQMYITYDRSQNIVELRKNGVVVLRETVAGLEAIDSIGIVHNVANPYAAKWAFDNVNVVTSGPFNAVTDNFTDGNYTANPAWVRNSDDPAANANWNIESWNGSNQLTGCTAWSGLPRITLGFGEVAANSNVNFAFDLTQMWYTAGNQFVMEMRQGSTVKHTFNLHSNPGSYGWGPVSGFLLDGWVVGADGAALNSSTVLQRMAISYDRATGLVELRKDGSVVVSHTFANLEAIDSISFAINMTDSNAAKWAFDNIAAVSPGVAAAGSAPAFSPDGGFYIPFQNVTITSPTLGATIRYTTDGTEPSETNGTVIASGSSVLVDQSVTLKAKSWATGYPASPTNIATYDLPVYGRPATIEYSDSIVVDGNLADWSDAQWIPLDQQYHWYPWDISEASYAAKWGDNGNKVYVAVKVRDTAISLSDIYNAWNARDAVELYIHTTGTAPAAFGATQEGAQQYVVGVKTDANSVWASVGDNNPVPSNAGFQASGKYQAVAGEEGGWLYYEAGITPYQTFSLTGEGLVASPLAAGQLIGFDVTAVAHDGTYYSGMASENLMLGKSDNYNQFAQHLLIRRTALADAKKSADGTAVAGTGVVSAAFTDFFYVESADRTYGIRVNKTAHGVTAGQLVSVVGTVGTLASSERYIDASSAVPGATTTEIAPLGMSNKSMGGVTGAVGLDNIGLLIRTTGRVTEKDTAPVPAWFKIDDGSGVSVKVFGSVPAGTPYVAITGVCSCEKNGSIVGRAIQLVSTQVIRP